MKMIKLIKISVIISLALCVEKMPIWFMPAPLTVADAAEMTVQEHKDVIPDAQSAKDLVKKTAEAQNVVDAKNDEIIGITDTESAPITVGITPATDILDPSTRYHPTEKGQRFPEVINYDFRTNDIGGWISINAGQENGLDVYKYLNIRERSQYEFSSYTFDPSSQTITKSVLNWTTGVGTTTVFNSKDSGFLDALKLMKDKVDLALAQAKEGDPIKQLKKISSILAHDIKKYSALSIN